MSMESPPTNVAEESNLPAARGGGQSEECLFAVDSLDRPSGSVEDSSSSSSSSSAPPPLMITEEKAKEALLALETHVRQAASKSIPNENEKRTWAELTWAERLIVCENLDKTVIEKSLQDYENKLQASLKVVETNLTTTNRSSSEIRAEGTCLKYTVDYIKIVAESIPANSRPWSDLKWTERLTLLENSDANSINAAMKAIQQERKAQEMAELHSKIDAEAAAVLAKVLAGQNFDRPIYRNLMRHGVVRNESNVKDINHVREEITRIILSHALFDGSYIEVMEYSFQEMFTWGQGGGYNECRMINKDELANLKPLISFSKLSPPTTTTTTSEEIQTSLAQNNTIAAPTLPQLDGLERAGVNTCLDEVAPNPQNLPGVSQGVIWGTTVTLTSSGQTIELDEFKKYARRAGMEPEAFLQLQVEQPTVEDGRALFSYRELLRRRICVDYEGLKPNELELHLIESDFSTVFKMSKDEYIKLKSWKQLNLKKEALLF